LDFSIKIRVTKTGNKLHGQMRYILIKLGQMNMSICGNIQTIDQLLKSPQIYWCLKEIYKWYGAAYSRMLRKFWVSLKEQWMLNNMYPYWRESWCKTWRNLIFLETKWFFNNIIMSNMHQEDFRPGLKSNKSSFWIGSHNLQILFTWNHLKKYISTYEMAL